RLGHEVASLLIAPSATRDRLTDNVFIGREDDDPVGLIERALDATMAAEPIHAKIRAAIKEGRLDGTMAPDAAPDTLALRAVASSIISADEAR
ncbi:acyl-CoA dehydrogenase domain-containing protein, partial [Streptomyces brasiliscabiei]|uniref:acyl-CoA dehydrogenase domain-containing protein n=1 Tax=Streptomyces brasiliscabiei TaxID=2736302 RepID=UPI0030151665